MLWQYDEVGITYDEISYQYNGSVVATIKKYYSGFAHTTKALFRRGLGF